MKIALLTPSFLPKVGGAQIFSHNISIALNNLGHDVDVYVPKHNFDELNKNFRKLLKPLPKYFYTLPRIMPTLGTYFSQKYLSYIQKKNKYDVWLIITTYPSGIIASSLKKDTTLILRASGEDIQKSEKLNYGVRLNNKKESEIKKTIQSYNSLVALTKSVVNDFIDLDASIESIEIIPNGVDLKLFQMTQTVENIRKKLTWPIDIPIILTTGRNHPKKGNDLIPEIAYKIKNCGIEFKWYIVGKGSEQINDKIKHLKLEKYIITLPPIIPTASNNNDWRFPNQKLVEMYQAADIFAFPSLLETFGMVQLEAMAAGTAVISTDAPGCKDVINDGINGLQARAGDIDHFAYQLNRLLNDQHLREKLIKNALEFVEDYKWENIAKNYENLFLKFIK